MIGLTADEGSGLNMNYRVADPAKYEAILRARTGALSSAFEQFYPAATPTRSFPALIRDGGVFSVLAWNRLRAKTSRQPLYNYVWTHIEPGPQSALYGAFHTSEVPYVFRTLDKAPQRRFTAEDRKISDTVSRYWVNFVKTGNPNDAGLRAWPQFGDQGETIELGGSFGPYPRLAPKLMELFQRHVAGGGWLLVM